MSVVFDNKLSDIFITLTPTGYLTFMDYIEDVKQRSTGNVKNYVNYILEEFKYNAIKRNGLYHMFIHNKTWDRCVFEIKLIDDAIKHTEESTYCLMINNLTTGVSKRYGKLHNGFTLLNEDGGYYHRKMFARR